MKIAGSNTVDTAGKAYQFQMNLSGLNFDGATSVRLTFDLKAAVNLNAAALHLQTEIPGPGFEENLDIQNQGLNDATWTSYTFDFTGVDPGATTFLMRFNIASGAVIGAGGEILVDNVKLIKQ